MRKGKPHFVLSHADQIQPGTLESWRSLEGMDSDSSSISVLSRQCITLSMLHANSIKAHKNVHKNAIAAHFSLLPLDYSLQCSVIIHYIVTKMNRLLRSITIPHNNGDRNNAEHGSERYMESLQVNLTTALSNCLQMRLDLRGPGSCRRCS